MNFKANVRNLQKRLEKTLNLGHEHLIILFFILLKKDPSKGKHKRHGNSENKGWNGLQMNSGKRDTYSRTVQRNIRVQITTKRKIAATMLCFVVIRTCIFLCTLLLLEIQQYFHRSKVL